MHDYREIMPRAVGVIVHALSEQMQSINDELQTSGATRLVKSVQAITFAKSCFAVGLVATFEAHLKSEFKIREAHAFKAVDKVLRRNMENDLADLLRRVVDASNALKHGDGPSYSALSQAQTNPSFKVKAPSQVFFHEGDVSEIQTLVQVDDAYLAHCEAVLLRTLEALRKIQSASKP